MHAAQLPPPTDNPASLLAALWLWLRDKLAHGALRFGDPVGLWDRATFTRAQRDAILAWLKPLEAILRRLLLAEACAAPAPKPKPKRPMTKRPAPALRDGEPCRASFRLFPSSASPVRTRSQTRSTFQPYLISSRPLSRRFNAFVRTLNNQAAAIRRAAKRLARRCVRFVGHGLAPAPLENLAPDARQALALLQILIRNGLSARFTPDTS